MRGENGSEEGLWKYKIQNHLNLIEMSSLTSAIHKRDATVSLQEGISSVWWSKLATAEDKK